MSRTTSLLIALTLGLVGCARGTESSSLSVRIDVLDPLEVSTTSVPLRLASDTTNPIEVDSRAAIVRDFSAAVAERTRCGQSPDRCAVATITAKV